MVATVIGTFVGLALVSYWMLGKMIKAVEETDIDWEIHTIDDWYYDDWDWDDEA